MTILPLLLNVLSTVNMMGMADTFLTSIISFLVLISILVFVHELGHFLAAKRVGVCVETFSLGFGPKLLRRKYGDTEYCLSGIPLGGYVKLKGENPYEEITGAGDELMSKSVPSRFSIFLAGPLMNVILAILLFTLIFYVGIEMPKQLNQPPIIGIVDEQSPAQTGGLRIGDVIRKVGGEQVKNWEEVIILIDSARGKTIDFEIERAQVIQTISIPLTNFQSLGIQPEIKPNVGTIIAGSPAEKAGLQPGDEIVAINGNSIARWDQLVAIVSVSPDKELQVTILRNGQTIRKSITPMLTEGKGRIGISPNPVIVEKYGLIQSFIRGLEYTWDQTKMLVTILRRLVTLKASAKNSVSGPISIAQMSGEIVKYGGVQILQFMGLISLSLGVFNLLPIPVLDGGHIFLLLVELLNRKPLSTRKREIAQMIGLLILVPLFVFIFYNDIMRVIGQ